MGPMSVAVTGEPGQDLAEMPLADDQHVIQALTAQRSREPPGKCACPGRPDRGLDHPRVIGEENAVACGGELAVPVTNQEPELAGPLAKVHDQVPGLPDGPGPGGM